MNPLTLSVPAPEIKNARARIAKTNECPRRPPSVTPDNLSHRSALLKTPYLVRLTSQPFFTKAPEALNSVAVYVARCDSEGPLSH